MLFWTGVLNCYTNTHCFPGYNVHIGQNLAWGYPNWMRAISAWYNEIDMYIYGKDPDSYLGEGGWREIHCKHFD